MKASRSVERSAASWPPRKAAAAALAEVRRGGKLDGALERFVRHRLERRDASFAEELAKAVVRNRRFIDYQLSRVASEPLGKLPPAVVDVLRIGAVELFLMNTPAYAAVAEAVSAVKGSRFAGLAPFVNGVLRRLASWDAPAEPGGDDAERLGVKYSHPDWLVRRWLERFGPGEAEKLLAANNAAAPLSVYPNPTRTDREGLTAALQEAGCRVAPGPLASLAVELGERRLTELQAFSDGLLIVIDPASSLGPRWLSPPAASTALDLCAGAGGKAVQLAWAVGPSGKVVAVDNDGRKLKACAGAARRLGLGNIEIRRADILKDELPSADYVFLDAPCTNLGVIRRKPDVKWRLRPEDVEAAAAKEESLLGRGVAALAPGGRLVYNVCSFEPEENERVVERVAERTGASLAFCPKEEFGGLCEGQYLRTWPHRDGCNGGFVAMLRRRN